MLTFKGPGMLIFCRNRVMASTVRSSPDGTESIAHGGLASFLKLVLALFAIVLVGLVLLRLLGGDDGTLPFDYDGFG